MDAACSDSDPGHRRGTHLGCRCRSILDGASGIGNRIQQHGIDAGLRFFDIPANSLDHGATVPSYFPSQAEWIGDIVVTGLGPHEGGMLEKLDTSIRSACDDQGLSLALISVGDMSHRTTASAPCEFYPDAPTWDQDLIRMVQETDSEAIEPEMRRIDHPSQRRTQRIDVTGHSPIRQGGETD